MKYIKFIFVILLFITIKSCNVDFLNLNTSTKTHTISSTELFNKITEDLSLPKFKSLNENELLSIYAIDPKILIDYVANVPSENISGVEISVFRLKDKNNSYEVVLGVQRRIKELEKEFRENKPNEYYLISNPYLKVIDNYVVFALYNDVSSINKIFDNTLN